MENTDNDLELPTKRPQIQKIGNRNVGIIFILGIAGQIAWAVENSWFNTFVYDEITQSPRPIAWMVAASAITATITTILMGTLSDRTRLKMGRRKPYIVFGYIFWGILTAIFPMIAWIQDLGIAVVMVVIIDSIMTFFGSTANDAAFNAWLNDVSHSSNRNRIQSFNQISILIANLIALGAAGFIIEEFGYFVFFYGLGGIVSICGIIAQFIIKEAAFTPKNIEERSSYWKKISEIFTLKLFKENKTLLMLFINMAIAGIAAQVSMPYLFIYIEYYLKFSKSDISIIGGAVILGSVIFHVVMALISHKFNRKKLIVSLTILSSLALITMMFVSKMWSLTIVYLITLSTSTAVTGILMAWMQDQYPTGEIGRFQGIRMIFYVLIPMVIGPPIGAGVIERFGIPTSTANIDGYIPSPEIFLVNAIIAVLSLIPILFIKEKEGTIQFDGK